MTMKVLTAHIPLDLAGDIDALAARLDRSRAWIVKQALEDYLAKQTAPRGFGEAPDRFGPAAPLAAERPNMSTTDDKTHAHAQAHAQAQAAHAQLLALRATTTLGDIAWRELRDAGRR
jgi:hypothetical protein